MAEAIRKGYADLYSRNEYAHSLSEEKLRGLVLETTGLDEEAATVRAITKSFMELCKFADFDSAHVEDARSTELVSNDERVETNSNGVTAIQLQPVGIGLSYTINLNLPETADIAVFNAIFKSLKENLLRRS